MFRIKLILLLLIITSGNAEKQKPNAYVTLVYEGDDGFVRAGVALGKSLLASHTNAEKVALVTPGVSQMHREMLVREGGWQVAQVEVIGNPTKGYVHRFDKIFTKLQIFSMTHYHRVVYLDADTIVNENVDGLFLCNSLYCAVVRNTFFNAGVMVITPSLTLYSNMIDAISHHGNMITDQVAHIDNEEEDSRKEIDIRALRISNNLHASKTNQYPDNDQGFMNAYFWNSERCDFFDPQKDSTEWKSCRRLPASYNGDIAIYALRGDRWLYDPDTQAQNPRPMITHFTFGAMKPWHWWTYLFIAEHWTWWQVYSPTPLDIESFCYAVCICLTVILFRFFKFCKLVLVSAFPLAFNTPFIFLSTIPRNRQWECFTEGFPHVRRSMLFFWGVAIISLCWCAYLTVWIGIVTPVFNAMLFFVVYGISMDMNARLFISPNGIGTKASLIFASSLLCTLLFLLYSPFRIPFFLRIAIAASWLFFGKFVYLTCVFIKIERHQKSSGFHSSEDILL